MTPTSHTDRMVPAERLTIHTETNLQYISSVSLTGIYSQDMEEDQRHICPQTLAGCPSS